jgi:hypothetical protein
MDQMTRRALFRRGALGLGATALTSLLAGDAIADATQWGGMPELPHFPPKAKRVICLFQSGGPSQIELFDYKPQLAKFAGENLPESVRNGQRLTGMSASQSSFPVVPSGVKFSAARGIGSMDQ